ncbi:MAG: gfo/Idh/MocA family oxidoreductase, partial [Verrucomicrobia bacterium]|nr:gfo/Idh/MocA family oxidoreductase [Verrucomicrobiota bacterium]
MSRKTLQIAMNGVTGRMGRNQHLIRSILALQNEGGLLLQDGTRLYPEPVLIGRDQRRLQELASNLKVARWTTD